jgi:hypothetical protein
VIRTAALYFMATGGSVALLTVVGAPVRQLLSIWLSSDSPHPPSAILGIPTLQLFVWYWLRFTDADFRTGVRVLVAASALALIALNFHRRRSLKRCDAVALGCAVGTALALLLFFSHLLALDTPTTFTAYNADAQSYVIHAQHLVEHGIRESGPVPGMDFGRSIVRQGFGAYVGLAALSGVAGIPVWNVGAAFIFAVAFLCVLSMAWLLRQILRVPLGAAIAAASLSAAGLLYAYLISQYFLAQLITMSLLPVAAGILLTAAQRVALRERVALLGILALLLFGMLATYGHVLFLAPVVLGASASFSGSDWIRRSFRVGFTLAGAFVTALVLAPTLSEQAYRTLRFVGEAEAGWPLSTFLPVDLLGFTRSVNPAPSAARWLWSAFILILFAGGVVVLRARQPLLARFAAATATCTIVSYAAIYMREGGPTYRQWKWITLFGQMVVPLVVVVIVSACATRISAVRIHAAAPAIMTAGLLGVYAVGLIIVSRAKPGPASLSWGVSMAVTKDLSQVGNNPTMRSLSEVNVEAIDKWDSMWLMYFLRNKTTYLLEPNYYPTAPPTAAWTVERISAGPAGGVPLIERAASIPLSPSFRLFREISGCPSSSASSGLDGEMTVQLSEGQARPGALLSARVTAVNTGTACWSTSITRPGGVVLVGEILHSGTSVATTHFGADLVSEGFRPLRSGDSSTIEVRFHAPVVPGKYELTFELQSDGVGKFGDTTRLPVEID